MDTVRIRARAEIVLNNTTIKSGESIEVSQEVAKELIATKQAYCLDLKDVSKLIGEVERRASNGA